MSISSIEQLQWLKICEGDIKTFNTFFKSKYKSLCISAFMILKQEALAEDIVQGCFIMLWERRHNLRHITNIDSYLFVIVKNACLDELRKQKLIEDIENVEDIRIDETPYELLRVQELGAQIEMAISKLPKQCKEIFEKVYIEGGKYQEVANTMGVSINTVKTQLKRAAAKLRIVLKEIRW